MFEYPDETLSLVFDIQLFRERLSYKLVSLAAVIRVVTQHFSRDPNNGCEGDYLQTGKSLSDNPPKVIIGTGGFYDCLSEP